MKTNLKFIFINLISFTKQMCLTTALRMNIIENKSSIFRKIIKEKQISQGGNICRNSLGITIHNSLRYNF